MKNNFLNDEIPGGLFADNEYSNKYVELATKQLLTAKNNEFKMICAGCEKEFAIMFQYKCFFCRLWFCPTCAKEHFGIKEN